MDNKSENLLKNHLEHTEDEIEKKEERNLNPEELLDVIGYQKDIFIQEKQKPDKKKSNKALKIATAITTIVSLGLLSVAISKGYELYKINKNLSNYSPELLEEIEKEQEAYFELNKENNSTFENGLNAYNFNVVKEAIDKHYLFDKENVDFEAGMIKGYVEALGDPYTVYYTPEEYQELATSMSGHFYGVGIQVQTQPNGLIEIIKVFEDGSAYGQGLQPGDIIYCVNGEDITTLDTDIVLARIKGEEGTTVDLTIIRPSTGEYIDVTCERKLVSYQTLDYKMMDNKIGYITMASFDEDSGERFKAAYEDLSSQGMKSLILDLRSNGGGYLDVAVEILDYLLPEGTLVSSKDKNDEGTVYVSNKSAALNIPMVVLVNKYSASASEITTGALKDFDKATIIGEKTFGKGIVQSILPMIDGSALKLTVSYYYLPNGECINEKGIEPDIEIFNEIDKDGNLLDKQLEKAIEILSREN